MAANLSDEQQLSLRAHYAKRLAPHLQLSHHNSKQSAQRQNNLWAFEVQKYLSSACAGEFERFVRCVRSAHEDGTAPSVGGGVSGRGPVLPIQLALENPLNFARLPLPCLPPFDGLARCCSAEFVEQRARDCQRESVDVLRLFEDGSQHRAARDRWQQCAATAYKQPLRELVRITEKAGKCVPAMPPPAV